MKKNKENDKKVYNYLFDKNINAVFELLRSHKLNPTGSFVNGIFRLKNIKLTGIKKRANYTYRHVENNAGRTRKYVENVNYHYRCETIKQLLKEI